MGNRTVRSDLQGVHALQLRAQRSRRKEGLPGEQAGRDRPVVAFAEVSRVFNDVLAKLTAGVGASALVTTEKEMGTTTKVHLEDF